jgi:hypothetical protein
MRDYFSSFKMTLEIQFCLETRFVKNFIRQNLISRSLRFYFLIDL